MPLAEVAPAGRPAMSGDVADGLTRATELRPAAVILEDSHIADGPSLALLQFLVSVLPELRCMLLLTSRDDPRTTDKSWSSRRSNASDGFTPSSTTKGSPTPVPQRRRAPSTGATCSPPDRAVRPEPTGRAPWRTRAARRCARSSPAQRWRGRRIRSGGCLDLDQHPLRPPTARRRTRQPVAVPCQPRVQLRHRPDAVHQRRPELLVRQSTAAPRSMSVTKVVAD